MYDCSGLSTEADIYKVLNDWKIINAKYRLSDPSVCPTYLHHNGKPMIALWGIGLQGKGSTPAQFKTMMDNLQDLDGLNRNFPTYWDHLISGEPEEATPIPTRKIWSKY